MSRKVRSLKPVYKFLAVALAVYALAVLVEPSLLFVLMDDTSARVNATNIAISFYVFVAWFLATLFIQVRRRPNVYDWPEPRQIWLGLVWLLLCVSYTGYEHGWFEFGAVVYDEDGWFETATAVALFVCMVLLVASGLMRTRRTDARLLSALIFLAFVCFVLLMEEISWGQRIFGWATPAKIEDLNAQSETNLHNMFVGYNQLIRLVLSLALASMLLSRDWWEERLRRYGLGEIVPPACAIYFIPFLIYAHVYDELYEEVVGLFLVAYAYNLFRTRLKGQDG